MRTTFQLDGKEYNLTITIETTASPYGQAVSATEDGDVVDMPALRSAKLFMGCTHGG